MGQYSQILSFSAIIHLMNMKEKNVEATIEDLLDERIDQGKDLSSETKYALRKALDLIKKNKKYYIKKLDLPENTGKRWSDKDDEDLLKRYDLGEKIGSIAKDFKRTKGAIRARLIKYNRIETYKSCNMLKKYLSVNFAFIQLRI